MRIQFLVQDKSVEEYTVEFTKIGGEVDVTCTCQLQVPKRTCEHHIHILLNILNGETEYILLDNEYEVTNIKEYEVTTLKEWLCSSMLERLYNKYKEADRSYIEAERSDIDSTKTRMERAKERLSGQVKTPAT